MRRTLLVFDLDGTLIDSAESICTAVNQARQSLGLPSAEKTFLHQRIGLPAAALFEDLFLTEMQLLNIVKVFRERLSIGFEDGILFFPGVVDFLKSAKTHDFFLAIATNKPTALANDLIASSEISEIVDLTVGVGKFLPKPNPSMIGFCSENLKATEATMFGDRVEDMKAAVAAGINAIGVEQSFHTERELLDSGADMVFPDFFAIQRHYDQYVWGK